MKALFVNGGPRKNWTTVKMLDSAIQGAAEAGAETELIHLYDYAFKGCKSCFACKLKNAKTNGVCAIKDDLRPILEKAHEADVIVISSPIYFNYPTGVLRAFMERLMFPVLRYNPKINAETGEMDMTLLDQTVPTAMIYTMGSTEEAAKAFRHTLDENATFLKMIFGYTETLCSYSGYQFSDYSRYDIMDGAEQIRAKYRDEQLPKDLEAAYELGKRLADMAR